MGITLRIFLIVGSALVFLAIANSVRKSRIQMADSVFWVAFTLVILIIAIFPGIAYFFSGLLGFKSPSNFVFLLIIGLLLIREYQSSAQISVLRHKLEQVAQDVALSDHEQRAGRRNGRNSGR